MPKTGSRKVPRVQVAGKGSTAKGTGGDEGGAAGGVSLKTRFCMYHLQGVCRYVADVCPYAHSTKEMHRARGARRRYSGSPASSQSADDGSYSTGSVGTPPLGSPYSATGGDEHAAMDRDFNERSQTPQAVPVATDYLMPAPAVPMPPTVPGWQKEPMFVTPLRPCQPPIGLHAGCEDLQPAAVLPTVRGPLVMPPPGFQDGGGAAPGASIKLLSRQVEELTQMLSDLIEGGGVIAGGVAEQYHLWTCAVPF